ncbi:hypothetical protein VTH06DRAFT_5900 [Thermothelomyces fergusii]
MAIPHDQFVYDGAAANGTSSVNTDRTDAGNGAPRSAEIEPIAVCGIGLRLPGGLRNGEEFWRLLAEGRDARSEIPPTRFAIDGFDASLAGQKAIHTRHGYFLDDDLSRFDASFFSMSKKEIERCDPQQRLLLEVVRECLEDAGEVDYRGRPIGCYVGTFGQDWYEMAAKDMHGMGNYSLMGSGDLVLANRVSYEFDLHGPSTVIKTGCSASLVALHDACRALQCGDASGAIVCGTSLIMTPTTSTIFFDEGILSPDGSCKTFDAAANGFARAEGITAVYVKRLEDALRDGNPIRAVIRNTGSNSDGRSQGLTCPNGEAQEALMRKVYSQASLDPSETAFVECHGTGTPTGDPIEARAVGNVFGDRGVYIGSVKPNVGHSEGCSGLTSLIKAVLALEKGTIPPNIKFQKPNPRIPFAEKKLTVPLTPTAFPKDRAERISINSFGIGGSNAHVIVESASQYFRKPRPGIIDGVDGMDGPNDQISRAGVSRPELFLFSANSPASLDRQIAAFREHASRHPDLARDTAYTLAVHRERLPHRAFALVQDGEMLQVSSQAKAPQSAPAITMVFSGQGAQWPQMGRELILTEPSFRQDLMRMDEVLQGLRIPPKWSIIEELLKPDETSQVHRAELAQPLTTALQVALVRYLQRLGIRPAAVVGHSSGEIAAAYAAGHVSLEHAITIAYYRGHVASRAGMASASIGAMAAVGLGAAEVARFLHPGACVACENSPSSTTISGDAKAVQKTLASVLAEYPDVLARPLKVDTAYHSHHMAVLAAEYLNLLQGEDSISSCNAGLPDGPGARFFSSVTTRTLVREGSPLASPYYWVVNLVSPVRFCDAVHNLLRDDDDGHATDGGPSSSSILLEVGPHSALAGPLRQICEAAGRPCNYVSALIRGKNCVASLLSALGSLHQQAIPVDWRSLFSSSARGGGDRALAGLPTYPWDHSAGPFWYESRLSRDWRARRFPDHCLLGVRVVESPDTAPQWRNLLSLEHVPWLADHKVRRDIVFPLAGYVAMAGEAIRQLTGCEAGYRLRHVIARTALVLTEAEPVEMVTALRPRRLTDTDDSACWFEFAIASYTGSAWVKHCEGQVAPLDRALTLQGRSAMTAPGEEVGSLPRLVKSNRLYDAVARAGLVFGPEFRRLTDISTSATDGVARARLTVPASEAAHPFPGPMHPASIDACIQMLLVASVRGLCRDLRRLVVPTLIENVEISLCASKSNTQTKDKKMHIEAFCPAQGLGSAVVECFQADDGDDDKSQRVCLRMSGLQVTPLDNDGDGENSRSPNDGPVDVHAAAHLHWLPDFDFSPLGDGSLVRPPTANVAERELRETLTLLCILDSAERLAGLVPSQPHFFKYRAWLDRQAALARSGEYPLVADARSIAALDPPARRALLESTYGRLLALPGPNDGKTMHHAAAARAIKRVNDHAEAVFTAPAPASGSDVSASTSGAGEGGREGDEGGGSSDALNLLLGDGLLTDVYGDEGSGSFDFGGLVRRLAHARAGRLRVLEVGAGTGGTTVCLLRHLFVSADEDGPEAEVGVGGLPMYSEYVFTDISAGFFPKARERFRHAPGMRFSALDISRDPLPQGFAAKSFDLVVAPNVVHATPCLRETLTHLRTLLRDDGVLMVIEMSTETRTPAFVFGNFPGWWLGEADGRVWEPFASPERWDAELRAAGFKGAEAVVPDSEPPWQMSIVMLARPETGEDEEEEEESMDRASAAATSLLSGLENEGWDVTPCRLGHDPLPSGQDVISSVDLESRFFDHDTLTEEGLSAFQAMLRQVQKRNDRILWLTPPFQVKCRDPRGAQTLAVMRTIHAELNLALFTLELDYEREMTGAAARLISDVFVKKVQRARDDDVLNADREFVVDNGTLLVGRYRPFSLTRAQGLLSRTPPTSPADGEDIATPDTTAAGGGWAKTLRIRQPGDLSTLTWVDTPLPAALPPDHVEVRILAAGLNFRDVLQATGSLRLPSSSSLGGGAGPELGLEASGVITRVSGTSTTNTNTRRQLQPGDRVVLLSPSSTLTTRLVVPAALVARVDGPAATTTITTPPRSLLDDTAALAGAPVCYATVLHALLDAGRLRPGMSVLVHSACGGVGLAALEVCAQIGGIEVYATVGSQSKVEFLLARYPGLVARERVFSSRDAGFRDGVLRLTGGRGVDLVLNSLSGELLHASWECVAKYGTMLELGKRDLAGAGRLDMAPFLENRTYVGVDLYEYMRDRPERVGELLARYATMYKEGLLPLPDPVTCFEVSQVEQAFRHLQNGAHIGKVVVTMPDDPSSIPSQPSAGAILLDPDATYLLAGGAGGLGGSVASWLVEQGARHLTVFSRSAGLNAESRALFRELESMGCSVTAVAGSVENKEDVAAAVSSSGRPVKGVFQLATTMHLMRESRFQDGPFLSMKWSQWDSTIGPKVRGTWNLHHALAGQPLDFFWMASSVVTVVDEPGQANYSAGCVFLEAFCQYRHSLGLPATVLNICPLEGVGYVAENAQARRNMKAQGLCLLGESEFLDFVRFNLSRAGRKGVGGADGPGMGADCHGWKNPEQVVMALRSGSDLPLDHLDNRTNWRRDRRMGLYHNVRRHGDDRPSSSRSKTDRLVVFLDAVLNAADAATAGSLLGNPDSIAFLARETGAKIYELMMRPVSEDEDIDTRLTLAQIGLDSLMAIELRRWLRGVFGIAISVLEIVGSGSLYQLGEVIAAKLSERLANMQ